MQSDAFEVLGKGKLGRVCQVDKSRPLVTPTYFPAVSGASKGFRPIDLIRLITDSGYPRLLVSAYDIDKFGPKQKSWALKDLRRYKASTGRVFLDCGVFESYWLHDSRWGFARYAITVRMMEADFYAAFDGAVHMPSTRALATGFSPDHLLKSMRLSSNNRCVLIAHGTNPQHLVKAVASVVVLGAKAAANTSQPPPLMVAVPERECGSGIVERCGTIAAIRRSLDAADQPILLHILGCGHPISMAAYSSVGADSFDSTDWCEAAVDWRTLSMTDFGLLRTTSCPCRVCARFKSDSLQKGLLHNLLFYQAFCIRLQSMVREGTLKDFLLETMGPSTLHALSRAVRRR